MPRISKTNQERALDALRALGAQGGVTALPDVLKSSKVKPLMTNGWFSAALRLGQMPGDQIQPGGVWRCARETFVRWLADLAGEPTPGDVVALPALQPGRPHAYAARPRR